MLLNKFNSYLISDFISGDVITNVPYVPWNGEPAPIDEKINLPYLPFDEGSFKYNGRGRLLTALGKEIDDASEKAEADRTPEEAERLRALTIAYRDIAAFLNGLSMRYEEGDPLHQPSMIYTIFSPLNVIFYQNPTSIEYIEYRSKLDILQKLEDSKQPVSPDLIQYLTETQSKLFDGEENAVAREEKMEQRIQMHLSNRLITEIFIRTLYTEERWEQVEASLSIDESTDPSTGDSLAEEARLFSNSKSLIAGKEFPIPKMFSDNIATVIRAANAAGRQTAVEKYSSTNKAARRRNAGFSVQVRDKEIELQLDSEKLAIETAEQFASQLIKIRDAKVLQTFFALCKFASLKDTPLFRNVPISELMELVLKPLGPNKFNTPQRRDFSEILQYIAAMSISVSYQTDVKNPKTGKVKTVLREEKGVRIFRLVADYSIKKPYQSIPKAELQREHYDDTVITSFSGELLPGNPHMFTSRANVYFDSLLHLDANKDSKAILLGFLIQTRFNQNQDKEKSIEYDRGYLIELCDYAKTDNTKPSQATKQLENNFNKLIKAGIISKFSGLTNANSSKVKITPVKTPAIDKNVS